MARYPEAMAVEIAGQVCYRHGCENQPAFTAPRLTSAGLEIVWACGGHHADLAREEDRTYALVRLCQAGGSQPCGELATHIGVDSELRPVSACAEHVSRVAF